MAEAALKKLREQLTCSLCHRTHSDPKTLHCNHVNCQVCLEQIVVRDQQGQLGLTCPTCFQATPILDGGVADLQPATYINHLLDIQAFFERIQTPAAATPDGAAAAKETSACSEHAAGEWKYHCETCNEVVCSKCVLKGGKHHDHEYKVSKAFEMYRGEISQSLEPMERQIAAIKEGLSQLDSSCRVISDQQATVESKIQIAFKELQGVLNAREAELNSQLDKIAQGKLDVLAAQRHQLETTLTQLSSCLHLMKETLRTGSEGDMLVMKTNTPKQVTELTTAFDAETLKPVTKANIAFLAPADLTVACQNYAQVIAPGIPDPTKCYVAGEDLEEAIVRAKCVATLHAVDADSHPCDERLQSLECELVSEVAGTRVRCGVERKGESQYKISYQPTTKGRHQLHIKIEAQHVKGSPFNMAVKSQIENLGIPILTIDSVGGPLGVATNQIGEVVVTEWEEHCVSIFNPRGEKVRSFGTYGSDPGQFDGPHGVAVDNEGNILVADRDNHRIQKLTADGQFLAAAGTKGSEPLQFLNPIDVAFNVANNKVYVSDEGNNRIQVLNSDLTFSSAYGKKGSGKGRFNRPWGIACDSTGVVFVADSGNHRIQAFAADGKFLATFGRRGNGEGELDMPISIAVDPSGMVYVAERNNFRISVFTPEGVIVASFGKRGKGPGEFTRLSGVAVDNSGLVYVCDSVGNVVKTF